MNALSFEAVAAPILACHECGTVHRVHDLPPGTRARCTACGATLYRRHRDSLDRVLALYLTAAVLFVVANSFPFMTLTIQGREQEAELGSSVLALWNHDMPLLAAVVAACALVMPAAKISSALWVLVPLRLGRRPWAAPRMIKLIEVLHPWAMTEVYLLGVLVAYVKLLDLATIGLGVSMWAFAALILAMVAADAALDEPALWGRLRPQATTAILPIPSGSTLVSCDGCGQLVVLAGHEHDGRCACCGTSLHRRKPNSIARTWALLLTAAILYIPANILPVMTVVYFGAGAPDTILSGVLELAAGGLWPLAALVFFASILVPVLKLTGLTYLLVTLQRRSTQRLRDRTMLFRIIEQVGRWSMIDVFMIGILTALVNLGSIATIVPGRGAVCFAAVVIITMLGVSSFDPRLLWDVSDAKLGRPRSLRA